MRADYIQGLNTSDRRLDQLTQECSEVMAECAIITAHCSKIIKAITKLRLFGPLAQDPVTLKTYDNVADLSSLLPPLDHVDMEALTGELHDLMTASALVESDLFEYRMNKKEVPK